MFYTPVSWPSLSVHAVFQPERAHTMSVFLFTWPSKLINVLSHRSFQKPNKKGSWLLALVSLQFVITYFFHLFLGEEIKYLNSGELTGVS